MRAAPDTGEAPATMLSGASRPMTMAMITAKRRPALAALILAVVIFTRMNRKARVIADESGTPLARDVLAEGAALQEGELLLRGTAVALAEPASAAPGAPAAARTGPRSDLQRVWDRHALTLDTARPEAMAKRHAQGQRSAHSQRSNALHSTPCSRACG